MPSNQTLAVGFWVAITLAEGIDFMDRMYHEFSMNKVCG